MNIASQGIYAPSDTHLSDEFVQLESQPTSPISLSSNISSPLSTPSVIPEQEFSRSIPIPLPEPIISSRYQFPTFLNPSPIINMNPHAHLHNPLLDMPHKSDRKAPKKFTGRYDEVTQFIKHYKKLLDQCQVTSDADKCEGILEYCSKSVREFIEASPHYLNADWDELEAHILKYYDAEKEEMKFNLGEFLNFLSSQSKKYITNLEKWKQYYREYMSFAGHLNVNGYIDDQQLHGYFWLGLPLGLKEILEDRLIGRYPTHNTSNPWQIEQISAVAESHFKRGKYSDRLLQFPNRFAPAEDTEYASESESESDQYDSDSDSDYDRRRKSRKHRHRRRKLKKSREKPKKQTETRQIEEDRSRTISAPQEEMDGIISKLNSMSIQDPAYGQLYFNALKSDPTGIMAQCITRKPLQENMLPTPATFTASPVPPPSRYYPPASSSQPQFRRPTPTTYPNSMPLRNQGPFNAPPSQAQFRPNQCFGCHDPQHRMRDCPKMAEMVKKGILYFDANHRYLFRDGRRLARHGGESFIDCIKRMNNEENPGTVNFITRGNGKPGEIYRNDPPTDVYWTDTDDHDDGPYRRYGQTVALAGTYPTYTQRDAYTEEFSSSEYDSDAMDYHAYPVERSDKRTTQARKEITKSPSKVGSRSTERIPKPRAGLRTRSFGPIHQDDMDITPPPTDRRTKSNHPIIPAVVTSPNVNVPPIERPSPSEPTPFDARKLRFNEDFPMRDSSNPRSAPSNSTPTSVRPPTLANVPSNPALHKEPTASENEKNEKARTGPRQSEISSQVDPRAVCQEILDTKVELPLRKLLGSSKELSVTMQEIIKYKNATKFTNSSTTLVAPKETNPQASVLNSVREMTPKSDEVLIRLTLYCEDRPIQAVIDTGSQLNVINENLALEAIRMPIDLSKGIYMNDANGGAGYLKGLIENVVLTCGANRTRSNLHVGENVPFDLLLGRPWQRGNFVSIDERLKGTYLVFKHPKTCKVLSEIFVTPDSMAPRTFPPLRQVVNFATSAPASGPFDKFQVENKSEFQKFQCSHEALPNPQDTLEKNGDWGPVETFSMLRSTEAASALVKIHEMEKDLPKDDLRLLAKLQNATKRIEMVYEVSNQEMEDIQDLLSHVELTEQIMEAELTQSSGRTGREAKNVKSIEFTRRNAVERGLTKSRETQGNTFAEAECSIDNIDSAIDIIKEEEPVKEIFSPQLMSDENSPTYQPHTSESVSSIQFVAHHAEIAQSHAHFAPNPHFSASFTTDSAVLAGIGYRESNASPLTFLEVTGDPAQANFHAHGEDFRVQGRLYTFFVTPNDSPIPFDLLSHLRRGPPPDDEMIRARDDDHTATHHAPDNLDSAINLVTSAAEPESAHVCLPTHHFTACTSTSPPPPYLPVPIVAEQPRQTPPPVESEDAIPRRQVYHVLAQLATPVPPVELDKTPTTVPDVKPPREPSPELSVDVKNALVSIVKAIQEYEEVRARADSDVEPLDLNEKTSSDAPDEPPAGEGVLVNAPTDEAPIHHYRVPPPYDPNDNPSIPALLRALPINISRRQYLLNHTAAKAEQDIYDDNCLPPLQRIDPHVEQYGLPVDPKAAQKHLEYVQWEPETEKDDWLLAYAPFYREDNSSDSPDLDPYEYFMFLMKGPGYAQDTFFIIGNQHPNESKAHFLPPIPAADMRIRVYPPNMSVLSDLISLLRREKLFPSGIRVPPGLMQDKWVYTYDIYNQPVYRLPKVEQLFAVAIALANRIDRTAIALEYPFYIPRYIMKPVYPLVKENVSSSDPSSSSSSSDEDVWDMLSDDSDFNPRIISGRSSTDSLSSPLDSLLDKHPFKADDFAMHVSKIPFSSDAPILNIRVVTHPQKPTTAVEFHKIPSGETLPPSRVSSEKLDVPHEDQETVPMQCVRIRGSEDHGEQLYYFQPDQLRSDDFCGVIGYGQRIDDHDDQQAYIFLHPTTEHDAHERIAYRSVDSSGTEVINYVPVPHTPYALNAARRLTLNHHYGICNFLAYLEGIPVFDHGVPIPSNLRNEYVRTGVDNNARPHQRYPQLEEFIATILLFLHHKRLHTHKSMKHLDELQPLVSPLLPRQLNPTVPITELHPTRLPYYPAQFEPFEPKDPLDDHQRLHYTGCLNRLHAFKLLNYLPKFSNTLGLATAATTDLLSLHAEHPIYPSLPIDDDIDWNTLTHPFDYSDLFYGQLPEQIMKRVRNDDVYHSSWCHHLQYLLNCRRQINLLLEIYESFFRAIGFRGFRDVFRQVQLNTVIQNYPAILTFSEATYFTAVYDFFLREHHFALAREVLALLNVPFSGSFDILLLRQHVIDEIAPPTSISIMALPTDDPVDDEKNPQEQDGKDE